MQLPTRGDRLIILGMTAANAVPRGTVGKVISVRPSIGEDRAWWIGMEWDNGDRTSILTPPDTFILVDKLEGNA